MTQNDDFISEPCSIEGYAPYTRDTFPKGRGVVFIDSPLGQQQRVAWEFNENNEIYVGGYWISPKRFLKGYRWQDNTPCGVSQR